MKEKRDFARISTEGKVVLEGKEAALDNVSFGGFSMYVSGKISVDTLVSFSLEIQLVSTAIKGKGRIRFVNANVKSDAGLFVAGVEFTDINRDELLYLINRIQARQNDQLKNKQNVRHLDYFPY